MMLMQQWQYLNLTRKSFASYILQKVSWVTGKSFISISKFVKKELVHSLAEHF